MRSNRSDFLSVDSTVTFNGQTDRHFTTRQQLNGRCVGSPAKGESNLHNCQGNYQSAIDTAVDYPVLQIMANLINQSDADSYATIILIAAGGINYTFQGRVGPTLLLSLPSLLDGHTSARSPAEQ